MPVQRNRCEGKEEMILEVFYLQNGEDARKM